MRAERTGERRGASRLQWVGEKGTAQRGEVDAEVKRIKGVLPFGPDDEHARQPACIFINR